MYSVVKCFKVVLSTVHMCKVLFGKGFVMLCTDLLKPSVLMSFCEVGFEKMCEACGTWKCTIKLCHVIVKCCNDVVGCEVCRFASTSVKFVWLSLLRNCCEVL